MSSDLKCSYKSTSLSPIYASTGSVATISADGSLLACPVLDEINIIQLIPNRKLLHSIDNADEQEITGISLTPDGKYLIYVSQSQLVKIVNVETGVITRSLKVSSPSYVMTCDPTSTLVAIGGTDGSITVIDIENGYIAHSFKGHGGTISSLKFYGELGTNIWLLGSGDTNGMAKVWDLVTRKCKFTVQEHSSAIRGIDFTKNDDKDVLNLITGGRDNVLNLWRFNIKGKSSKLVKTIPAHLQIEACGFIAHNDETFAYTAGGDAVFQIIDLNESSVVKCTKKPIEELFITGVIPINQGNQFYVVLSDQTIQLLQPNSEIFSSKSEFIQIQEYIAGNHGTVADLCLVTKNKDCIALATNSPSLRIIPLPKIDADTQDTDLPIEVNLYEGHSDLLNSLACTEDGQWLATASKDKTAILWHWNNNSKRFYIYATFVGHAASVSAVCLPNVMEKNYPKYIITASNDLTVKKWEIPPMKNDLNEVPFIVKSSIYTRHAHEKDINAISMAPNDSIFATASYDKTCKLWNVDTGEPVATLANHKRGLWDVSFCESEKWIATCSGDKTVKIWSLESFTVLKTLEGHTNAVQRCSFMNKQKQLVSAGADGLIKVWDIASGDCIKNLDGHSNRIWALSVLEDGDLIISADADGVFQFWKDCTEAEIQGALEENKVRVEQEQSLTNYMNNGEWSNAFLLALQLDHPMRLFNVLRSSMGSQPEQANGKVIFNQELDSLIGTLNKDQLIQLMKRCRDWNTNARTHMVAQKTISCIFLNHDMTEFGEIPGMVRIVETILPYSKRHYSRVDNLVKESYLLDYALHDMDKLL
ncbi:U3 small nucleolar RNA-associated protein 13 [Nakaseomyces glabratus]|nr:U3 small nucleolar RNA-associated protein 13 [Nakaseomyces glabratus]KTB16247.1 U3 small nucleolar RNA-associated protein 13 [Nakaseomyces glabratus]